MMKRLIMFLAVLLTTVASAQTVIKLNPVSEGKYTLDASLNGVGVKTYYTEESWFASVSSTTYLFLYENGYIADGDVKGMTVVKMPDGSTEKAGTFVIRKLKIGNNVIVKDLPAFVIKKQNVPLIVGNSSFDCFGEVVLKDDKLLIYDGIERPSGDIRTAQSEPFKGMQESLRDEAQAHMEAREYRDAAQCFEALMDDGGLSQYEEYQYILVLNSLGRNDEALAISEKWLAAYGGRTSNLGYKIYEARGDAYARKGSRLNAINAYENAVSAYYAMFNISEKDLLRNDHQDTTLGYTLFNLARQYAANGNLLKSQHNYFLSSKCGNQAAIDVCREYKIKR